jgi:hypothetical protein
LKWNPFKGSFTAFYYIARTDTQKKVWSNT